VLMRSSGTTGRPKYVPLNFLHNLVQGQGLRQSLELQENDRGLGLFPIYLSGGFGQLVACLLSGTSVYFAESKDFAAIATLIGSGELTWFSAPPPTLRELLSYCLLHPELLSGSAVRRMRTGGAAIDASTSEAIENIFRAALVPGYGSTETGLISAPEVDPQKNRPGSIGTSHFHNVMVVDDDGLELPRYELGEIVVSGDGVIKSYLSQTDNVESFFGDWYRTGDLGYLDVDGYIYLKGRKKELINRGGEKILPQEVTAVLLNHGDVVDAVVFSIPHQTLGEEVVAAVVLRAGSTISERELGAYCAEHLSLSRSPKSIYVLDHLPTLAAGKVDVHAIRAMVLDAVPPVSVQDAASTSGIEEELMTLFHEILDSRLIKATDNFFLNGGDSLRTARLIAEIDRRWGKKLLPVDIFRTGTPRLIAQLLEQEVLADNTVMSPIQHGSKQVPFFYLHGDLQGVGKYALDFARLYDPERQIYALPPHGTSGLPRLSSIEAMADDYIGRIRSMYPSGPYLIGGYCNGGIVAFEIARRLTAEGHEVGPVILVGASPINGYFGWIKPISSIVASVLRLGDDETHRIQSALRTRALRVYRRMSELFPRVFPRVTPQEQAVTQISDDRPESWVSLYTLVGNCMSRYFPQFFDGRVHVIWSTGDDTRTDFPHDPSFGWGKVVRDLSTEYVPGDHLSIVWRDYPTIARAAKHLHESYN